MFLEQFIDFLFWCVPWLISEIRCPSRQRQDQQESSRENTRPFLPLSDLAHSLHSFEYKEFPERDEPEDNENEVIVLIENTASTSMLDSNALNVECHTRWFVPDKSKRGPLLSSISRSFFADITLMLSAIVISGLSGLFVYVHIEITDKCIGNQQYLNTSIPEEVVKWKLIGESLQDLLLNLWFPVTIALLFGRKVFLEKFASLLLVGLIMGLLMVIYKAYLFIYLGDDLKQSLRYPGNAIFLLGVLLSCIQIARATKRSIKSIVLKIGQVFVFSLFMSLGYRNFIVPWFNEQTNEIIKAMIAAILPLFSLIPVAVGKYVVLCHCNDFVEPEVSFILIYFNYLVPVALYRIMQAELKDLRLFVAFSLLHGTFKIIAQVTRHFREKLWGRTLKMFEKYGWRRVPYASPRNRRLQADLEIQDMLFQFGTLILAQVYMMLYRFSTFVVAFSGEIERIYSRVVIGLAIEFAFAWLSTYFQIYLYNIPIRTVWIRQWGQYVLANTIIMAVAISYFSHILLSVLKFRVGSLVLEEFSVRNCTLPFNYC